MQESKTKSKYLKILLGKILKEERERNTDRSCNKAEEEFEISRGNLNRIENGKIDPTFTTLWKAAEASNQKLSNIIIQIENLVGEDFTLSD